MLVATGARLARGNTVLVGGTLSYRSGESIFIVGDASSALRHSHCHHLATTIAPVGLAPNRSANHGNLLPSAP
jgi:NADH dehydrogenase FAD-containing subunit